MSDLRRRLLSGIGIDSEESSPTTSREASPAPGQRDGAEYKVIPTKKLEKLKEIKAKGTKRRNFWIFAFGGVFGILLAGFFASRNGSLEDLVGITDVRLDALLDVLPAGLIKDVRDIQVSPRYPRIAWFAGTDIDQGSVIADSREGSRQL